MTPPAEATRTAAIYARISSEDQSAFSIATQIEASKTLATREGCEVPDHLILVDNGISGSTLERPGLRQLRDLVRSQAIQAVACLDPDRLSRSLGHLLLLEEEAKKYGVRILYVYFPREDTPEGKLMLSVRGAVAEYERAKIMQRSWNGKTARALAGLPMFGGCEPYGYRWVKAEKRHGGHLEIDPDEAAVVQRMFALRKKGLGVWQIVTLLTAEGVPTKRDNGKPGTSQKRKGVGVWSPSTVGRILRNPLYVGSAAWNKARFIEPPDERRKKPRNDKRPKSTTARNDREAWFEIAVPPIVDMATFEVVQQLMDHSRRVNPHRRRDYLFLSGRLRCGRCGYGMSGFYHGKRQQQKYRCTSAHHRVEKRCWNTVNADWLEEKVWSIVRDDLLAEPEYLARELARRQENKAAQQVVTTNDLLLVDGKLAACDQRLKRWQEAYADGAINLSEFKELKAGVDTERGSLERLKAELQAKLDGASRAQQETEAAIAFIRRVKDELPTYTLAEKRRVLEVLGVRAAYSDRKTLRLRFWIPAEWDLDPDEVFGWPANESLVDGEEEEEAVTTPSTFMLDRG